MDMESEWIKPSLQAGMTMAETDAGRNEIRRRETQERNVTRRMILPGLFAALAAMVVSTGCMLVNGIDGAALTHELRKTGRPAKAVVLKLSDTGMTINDDPVAWLELEVHPDGQPVFTAKAKCLISRLDVPQFQPGCTIPVVYDPADHSRVGVDYYK